MLVLKTVPLQDVKESPDKMFFGRTLNTNFPRPTHVHHSYEERYINKSADGDVPDTRNFQKNDPVWVKINDHLPWRPEVTVNIHPNQSFDVKVEDKVYHCNTHNLRRRYPKKTISPEVPNDGGNVTPKRTLRRRPRVKMSHIPVQDMMQDFIYISSSINLIDYL